MCKETPSKILAMGLSVFIVSFFLCVCVQYGMAQTESKVDLNNLIQETQQRSDKADEMTFVWWIPEEYWQVSFAQNPAMTQGQAEEFIKVFRPYTLILVVDAKVGTFGTPTYKSEAEIRNSIKLKDSQGNLYPPLSEAEVSVNTKNVLAMMKPMWTNTLGAMGQNMYFFLFLAQNKDGQGIAEAKKEGTFAVMLDEREFRWKLPLKSLLPSKICPTCNEKLSGAYKFCPWDGAKLE
jgi:hypothetical protein